MSTLVPFLHPRRAARRGVQRWCRRQQVQLLRWRDAKLFEGPSSWDVQQRHYRVQVMDVHGRRRGAYLTFKGPFLFERCVEALWDDPRRSKSAGKSSSDDSGVLVPVQSLPR
jgi:hypothetical protein